MFGVRTIAGVAGLGLLLGLGAPAHGQSLVGDSNDPSLVLLIWDPVNKVSYSFGMGLTGSTLYKGLSDAGSQQFWSLDPASDTSFAQFLKASPNLAQDDWMVIGGGKSTTGTGPGTNVIFSTMVNTVLVNNQPTLNPEWGYLTGVNNSQLRSAASAFQTSLYNPLNAGNGTAYNNYATSTNGTGSSFDTSSSNAYVGNMQPVLSDALTGLSAGEAMFGGNGNTGQGFDTGNLIGATGSSSWFYYLTPSSTKTTAAITVSAFSNSAQDAYWGLARTTDASGQQELVLSFTLPSAVTPTTTAQGAVRRNQTDYTAEYGSAQEITAPSGEFAGWTPSTALDVATPVPEPTTNLLMLMGLGGVLAATRRRAQRKA